MKLNVTAKLKAKFVELGLVKEDATDADIKSAVAEQMISDEPKITADEIKELCKDEISQKAQGVIGSIVNDTLKQAGVVGGQPNGGGGTATATKTGEGKDGETFTLPTWAKDRSMGQVLNSFGSDAGDEKSGTGLYAKVKSAEDYYSTAKSAPVFEGTFKNGEAHPYAGRNAFEWTEGGRKQLEGVSEVEKAVCGSWLKLIANQQNKNNVPHCFKMTDHDWMLLKYGFHELKWSGVIRGQWDGDSNAIGVKGRKLTEMEIKTIIDDVTSGGLEIAPIAFDEQVITIPILYGELAPFVNMVPVTRGRRIESATLGNLIINSSGSVTDDTAISVFATAGFISAFDTTIYVADGSIEIGLDFLSDTPIDITGHISTKYGEQMLAWLEEQIAIGDGTTEPEGIMNASGTTAVAFGGVAPTLGGYEELLFSIPKRYKAGTDRSRIRFASNEYTYRQARGIPVGSADARRIFGMSEENYNVFDHGYSIVDSMANTQSFFANLARYRMYRRMGMMLNITTEGRELTLNNKMLMVVRARYGGRLEDGNAAGVVTTHLA